MDRITRKGRYDYIAPGTALEAGTLVYTISDKSEVRTVEKMVDKYIISLREQDRPITTDEVFVFNKRKKRIVSIGRGSSDWVLIADTNLFIEEINDATREVEKSRFSDTEIEKTINECHKILKTYAKKNGYFYKKIKIETLYI